MNLIRRLLIIFFTIFFVGCSGVTSNVYTNTSSMVMPEQPKLLLMPAEIEIKIRKAGGDLELDVERSDNAIKMYGISVADYMFEQGIQLIPYGSERTLDSDIDLVREGNTIMDSIQLSQSAAGGLGSARNFSLSKYSRDSMSKYEADYVVFTLMTAITASAGRQTVAVLSAIAGVPVVTNGASFRVAVFDLRDGQCVWANFDPYALPDGVWVDADQIMWDKNILHMYQGFSI